MNGWCVTQSVLRRADLCTKSREQCLMAESSMASQKRCWNHCFYGNFSKGNPGGWTAGKSSCSRAGFQDVAEMGPSDRGAGVNRSTCTWELKKLTLLSAEETTTKDWYWKRRRGREEWSTWQGEKRVSSCCSTSKKLVCLFPHCWAEFVHDPILRALLRVESRYQQWNQTMLQWGIPPILPGTKLRRANTGNLLIRCQGCQVTEGDEGLSPPVCCFSKDRGSLLGCGLEPSG